MLMCMSVFRHVCACARPEKAVRSPVAGGTAGSVSHLTWMLGTATALRVTMHQSSGLQAVAFTDD